MKKNKNKWKFPDTVAIRGLRTKNLNEYLLKNDKKCNDMKQAKTIFFSKIDEIN